MLTRLGAEIDARFDRSNVRRERRFRLRLSRGQVGLRIDLALHAQDGLANFAAAIIDDRGLPIAVALLQLFEHRTGEAELGESGSELIFALEFFPLLRGHVGLEEDLRGIHLLGKSRERLREKREDGEEKQQPDFVHRQDGG